MHEFSSINKVNIIIIIIVIVIVVVICNNIRTYLILKILIINITFELMEY